MLDPDNAPLPDPYAPADSVAGGTRSDAAAPPRPAPGSGSVSREDHTPPVDGFVLPSTDSGHPPVRDAQPLHRPVPSSPYATWSLVAGTAAMILFLTGPVLGMIAVVLGILGSRQVTRAAGELRGRLVAAVGIVFGVLSIGSFVGVVVLYMFVARPTTSAMDGTSEAAAADDSTSTSPGRAPAATAPRPVLTTSTVTTIGKVTVVDIAIGVASLAAELKQQHAEATAHGERLLLETTSSSCAPCNGVANALSDPRMQAALDRVRIVRVDRDPFEDDLAELQIPSQPYPGFFLLDSDLKVKDGINGGEWGDDIAANIAPVLGPFVRGSYANRRSPWKKLPRGTVL